jgi:dUTP pyrophosphatase
LKLNVKKLVPEAIIPTYATDGDAGFDIYSLTEGKVSVDNPLNCSTGLAFEIPQNHVMLVFSRSGTGFKHDVRLANCVGVIDSGYRGELGVKLTADHIFKNLEVAVGDRIAQGIVLPYEQVQFVEVDELSSTQRGEGGFGSSGK